MLRPTICAFVFLTGLVLASGSSQAQQPMTANTQSGQQAIHIDGSAHPEMLPQWVIWEQTFNALDTIRRRNLTAASQSLHLTAAEAAVVFREAGGQGARRDECAARNEKIAKESRDSGLSVGATLLAQRPAILKYRTDILKARDRIMKALSQKGRRSLDDFVRRVIQGITVDVWPADLSFFKRPR